MTDTEIAELMDKAQTACRAMQDPFTKPLYVCRSHFSKAIRAAESSALERAAQVLDPLINSRGEFASTANPAALIRALIPPATAPAAETRRRSGYVCQHCGCGVPENAPCPHCRDGVLREEKWTCRAAPAAETGKGPGAEALLRECADELRACDRHDHRGLLARIAARAAPPEREGT